MMGIFLGYALVWSGSLWVPILIHFVNNTAAVIVSFYVNKGTLSDTFDTIGTGAKAILPVIISLVLTSGFIYLIYSFEKKKRIDNIIAPN
jgi:hypothetical protein